MKALGGVGVLAILLIALARQLGLNNVSACRAQSKSRHTALRTGSARAGGGRSDSDCCQINVSKHGRLFYVSAVWQNLVCFGHGRAPGVCFLSARGCTVSGMSDPVQESTSVPAGGTSARTARQRIVRPYFLPTPRWHL